MAEWTDADTDQFHLFLGRYVDTFQWLEAVLDEITLLARGHSKWEETQAELAKLTFAEKIKKFEKLATDPRVFPRMRSRPDWSEIVENAKVQLRNENDRRNHLLHSLMVPRLLEAGLPPHRSRRLKSRNGEPTDFDIVIYDHAKMKIVMEEVAQLVLAIGMIQVQLRHWC